MRDEHLDVSDITAPAERAVLYLLKRMQVDVNLRHHMIGTEAFAKLCEAEAARVGMSPEMVMEEYSTLEKHCRYDVADVVTLRKRVEGLTDDLELKSLQLDKKLSQENLCLTRLMTACQKMARNEKAIIIREATELQVDQFSDAWESMKEIVGV
jgi:predicted nuclease with TOPRIM domain